MGTSQKDDKIHHFQIPEACKVIAFAGVVEVLHQECRLLNLQVYHKSKYDDNELAEKSLTFKELTRDYFSSFSIFRALEEQKKIPHDLKRIHTIKLYLGFAPSNDPNEKTEVVGGIEIIYEMKDGSLLVNGASDLFCKSLEDDPQVLELKPNEYIASIYGTGKNYIQSLTLETNYYRHVKMGTKIKEDEEKKGGLAGGLLKKADTIF